MSTYAHTELERFRQSFDELDVAQQVGVLGKPSDEAILQQFIESGVKFSASSPVLTKVYYRAVRKLLDCIVPNAQQAPILQEGGVYLGCWLESTGTINAELCSRFIPSVAEATYSQFAALQREDGLLPYKITAEGAVFKQIQLVTPPARSVWNHYSLHGDKTASTFYRRCMRRCLDMMTGWYSIAIRGEQAVLRHFVHLIPVTICPQGSGMCRIRRI